jgi:hypothetical protein
MSKLMKFTYSTTGIWLLISLLLFIINHSVFALRGLWIIFCLFVALVLSVLAYIALFKERRKLQPLLAIALVIAISYFSINKLVIWGTWVHFFLNRGYYENFLKRVSAAQAEERAGICEGKCWIRSQEPLQVSFHYAHGFLNWTDIVYDPSGSVTQMERPSWSYLSASEHLTGNWYICHFND